MRFVHRHTQWLIVTLSECDALTGSFCVHPLISLEFAGTFPDASPMRCRVDSEVVIVQLFL